MIFVSIRTIVMTIAIAFLVLVYGCTQAADWIKSFDAVHKLDKQYEASKAISVK